MSWTHKQLLGLMGRLVLVHEQLERTNDSKDPTRRVWMSRQRPEPRAGWLVGIRRLQNGKYVPASGGYSGFNGEYDYEQAYLTQIKVVRCVLVTYWPTENYVRVPLGGFEVLTEGSRWQPFCSNWGDSASRRQQNIESYKQAARKEGWLAARDARGRWIPLQIGEHK